MISDFWSRGQSTTVLAVVGGLIVLVMIVVGAVILAGIGDAPTARSSQTTTTAPDHTIAPTATFAPTATATETTTSTVTATATIQSSPTATPTQWPKATITPTPSPTPEKNYTIFKVSLFNQLTRKPIVPIRLRGFAVVDKELLLTVNLTADSEDSLRRLREQNGILSAYGQTLLFYDQGKLSGDAPTQMRVLEVNNTGEQSRTFLVNNSVVREWSSGQIDTVEFHSRVYSTARNQTSEEKEDTRSIDRGARNFTLHNGTATPTDE